MYLLEVLCVALFLFQNRINYSQKEIQSARPIVILIYENQSMVVKCYHDNNTCKLDMEIVLIDLLEKIRYYLLTI